MANNNKDKVLNAPPLRFPEFSGEWEKHPLNELVERVSRKNKDEQSKLALTISAQYGLVDQETFFNKKVASADLSHYYLLKRGDFAYNKSYSTGYPWGAVKRLDLYEEGAVSTLYICFKPKSIFCSDYATHYFESTKWHKGVSDIAVEGARNHGLLNVSVSDYFDTEHFLPAYTEQCKIADFLNLIERRIATQIGLINKLQSLIIGIAKQLTRKGHANTRICDCLECHSSTLQESSVKEYGKYPVYGASGVVGYLDDYSVSEDTILIIKDGSGVGTTFYANGNYSVIGTLNYLTAKDGFNLRFLYYCLKVFHFDRFKTGMAIPHIYFKDYSRSKIYIPNFDAQGKIAKSLCAIDNKLQLEQQTLSLLYAQKAHLLTNLFI